MEVALVPDGGVDTGSGESRRDVEAAAGNGEGAGEIQWRPHSVECRFCEWGRKALASRDS